MTVLYLILAALVIFLAVLFLRTLSFQPKAQNLPPREEAEFDRKAAIAALAKLVRCKTISYYESEKEDNTEFEKLISLLPELYPEIFRACTFTRLADRGLLFCWPGEAHSEPSVMMAHYDVVPVEEQHWQKPPFDAIIEDGVMWGRGTLDTKVTVNGILTAANTLIKNGFVPEQDIYFAFSGGEEVSGLGAVHIVDWFEEHGITPALVVDEGGAVVEDVFPGVKTPCGLIGIAEKGFMNAEFSIQSEGGHSSAPAPHTPIGKLAKACCAVEAHPFPMHITKPAVEMFDTLGRYSTFVYRMVFANLWLFKGVLNAMCKKRGGELNALLRTTVAFTQASGSLAPNVIPASASLIANMRLNPEDRVQGTIARLKSIVNDNSINITASDTMEPSPISATDCPAWNKVAAAVAHTWPDCIVAPYLMVQCSDSRHYGRISNHVYRFSAMDLTEEERTSIHGNNERIRLECAERAVEFYLRLMKQC